MKRDTFYLLSGVIIILEILIVYLAALNLMPFIVPVAIIVGIIVLYFAKRQIDDVIEDERRILITQKAALRTLQVFWAVFFALSVAGITFGFGDLLGIPRKRPWLVPHEMSPNVTGEFIRAHDFGFFGMVQIGLLCLMIFLYVGFHVYYAKKYGEWEDDEE